MSDESSRKPDASGADTPAGVEHGVTGSLFAPQDWPALQALPPVVQKPLRHASAPREDDTATEPQDWLRDPRRAFEAWMRSPGTNRGRGFSEESMKVYGAMWGKFVRFCVDVGASAALANEGLLRAFLQALEHERMEAGQLRAGTQAARSRDSGGCGRQARRYLSLVARVQAHLVRLGLRSENHAQLLLQTLEPEPDRPLPSALRPGTDQRLRRELDHVSAAAGQWRAARDRAIVELLVGSGLTSRQLRSLRDDPRHLDLDESPAWVLPVPARRGQPRPARVPLSRDATAALQQWLELRRGRIPGDVLFPSTLAGDEMSAAALYRAVAEAMRLAQDDPEAPAAAHLGPRTLRHTFATRQLRAGRSLALVRDWLGHRSTHATAVYQALVTPQGGEPD